MIKENAQKILNELPDGVELVAAAKQRKPEEIMEAIEAGINIFGENYIGEAKKVYKSIGNKVKWHFIGISKTVKHDLLRRNVLEMFDIIETIDSKDIASELDKRCAQINKVMPILIENIKELVQVDKKSRNLVAGKDMLQLPTIKDAYLFIDNDII